MTTGLYTSTVNLSIVDTIRTGQSVLINKVSSFQSVLISVCPGSTVPYFIYLFDRSEANDLALTLAEAYTGHTEFIVLDGLVYGSMKGMLPRNFYSFPLELITVTRKICSD